MIIVITIMAILASIALPSLLSTGQHGAEAALVADLANVRSSISLYRSQHDGQLPGWVSGKVASNPTQTLIDQLMQYSDLAGNTSATKSATFALGPYVWSRTGFPACPIGAKDGKNSILVGSWSAQLQADAKEPEAWKYSTTTGEFICNDPTADSRGVPFAQY